MDETLQLLTAVIAPGDVRARLYHFTMALWTASPTGCLPGARTPRRAVFRGRCGPAHPQRWAGKRPTRSLARKLDHLLWRLV